MSLEGKPKQLRVGMDVSEPSEAVRAAERRKPIRAWSGEHSEQLSGQGETRSARLSRACPGWKINRAGSAGIKGSSEGTRGEGSAQRKSEELNPSGCKRIGQDCKAPNVGSGVGRGEMLQSFWVSVHAVKRVAGNVAFYRRENKRF